MIEGILITPLSIIDTSGGNVMHGIKKSDKGYSGFGEAYFSNIDFQEIKAWKRHRIMTLNIIVPVGKIRFVFMDDRVSTKEQFQEVIISEENYSRITVPPMIWMGFQGMSNSGAFLLNIADIEHNPEEIDKREISEVEFNWSNK